MSDQTIPSPHGPVTIAGQEHEHVWGGWMVSGRTTKRRLCVLPGCLALQHREVKS